MFYTNREPKNLDFTRKIGSFCVRKYKYSKGVNCTHDFHPFWEGISVMPADMKEPVPVMVNGKEYDYYQASQKQRQMERNIRATKREIEAQKAIGGDTAEFQAKLRAQNKEYRDFSEAVNMKPKNNRLRVASGTSAPKKKNAKASERVREDAQKVNKSYDTNTFIGKNVRFKTGKLTSREYAETKRPLANFRALPESKVVSTLRTEARKWIKSLTDNEKKAIEKYTLNSGDRKPDRFFERLNEMLRGAREHDDNLQRYADTISSALAKNSLQHDVICYRRINTNAYGDYKVGEFFKELQFISTSVVESKALKGEYEVIIYVKKGSRCGYIEEISKKPNQRKLLIDKNTIFRVISKYESTVELEVI